MMSRTETPGRASSLRGCILTVFLSVWMDLTSGIDIQLIPQYPKVGQTVTLSGNGVTGSLCLTTWYKGGSTDLSTLIFIYIITNTPIQTNGPQYFSRAKALTNGSLQISDLSKEDEGNYTVQIQTDMTLQQATVYLPVYDDSSSIDVPPETNAPYTTDFLCSAATAAIVCGTILAIFLIIGFLLYKRYILPVRRGHRGPPTEGPTSDTVYENALGNTMHQGGLGQVAQQELAQGEEERIGPKNPGLEEEDVIWLGSATEGNIYTSYHLLPPSSALDCPPPPPPRPPTPPSLLHQAPAEQQTLLTRSPGHATRNTIPNTKPGCAGGLELTLCSLPMKLLSRLKLRRPKHHEMSSGNMTILLLVSLDPHLHTPMYFFLGNLSVIDMSSTTVNLHKIFSSLLA
ncbi:uncharacterized protein O3C94_016018 [Discoglossus pictus]